MQLKKASATPLDCYSSTFAQASRLHRVHIDACNPCRLTSMAHSFLTASRLIVCNKISQRMRPIKKRVSDITYIWAEQYWLYLAVVLERYSRRGFGSAIGEGMVDAGLLRHPVVG